MINFLNRKLMLSQFEVQFRVLTQQLRRFVKTTRRKIGSSLSEGLWVRARHRGPNYNANARKSVHGTMM
jgi:steroid 5-alpha reductase family enzyme